MISASSVVLAEGVSKLAKLHDEGRRESRSVVPIDVERNA